MSDSNKKSKLNAVIARVILLVAVVITIIGSVAGFYFALKQLKVFANETSVLTNESRSSTRTFQQLTALEKYMSENKDDIRRAANITSTDEAYQYQNDFVRELSRLGRQSGVDITKIKFGGGEGDTATGTAPAAPEPGATTPLVDGSAATTPVAGGSLQSVSCTVEIRSPLPYDKFLKLLKLIEANPKRMQITSVSLSGPRNGGSGTGATESGSTSGESLSPAPPGSVTTEDLEIKVYLQ